MQQSNVKRKMIDNKTDGDAPTNHGDESSVFPEADYYSEENEGKLTAAETHYNNSGYGTKSVVVMAIGLKKRYRRRPPR